MIKVLPLAGINSFHASQAYKHVLLGLKMLPQYSTQKFSTFYADIEARGPEAIEEAIREAVAFVRLEPNEIETVLSFTTDPNGIPYCSANIANLTPEKIFEGIVAVFLEISKIPINLVTPSEKKK